MLLNRKFLQTSKFKYVWTSDNGVGEYAKKLYNVKVDRSDGYEVLHFIQEFLTKYKLNVFEKNIHLIENIMHSGELSSIVMKDQLNRTIAKRLRLI